MRSDEGRAYQDWVRTLIPGTATTAVALCGEPWGGEQIAAVYFIIRSGEVVYVGMTSDLVKRIGNHRRGGRQFECVLFLPFGRWDSGRVFAERFWIARLLPCDNSAQDRANAIGFVERMTLRRTCGGRVSADTNRAIEPVLARCRQINEARPSHPLSPNPRPARDLEALET